MHSLNLFCLKTEYIGCIVTGSMGGEGVLSRQCIMSVLGCAESLSGAACHFLLLHKETGWFQLSPTTQGG